MRTIIEYRGYFIEFIDRNVYPFPLSKEKFEWLRILKLKGGGEDLNIIDPDWRIKAGPNLYYQVQRPASIESCKKRIDELFESRENRKLELNGEVLLPVSKDIYDKANKYYRDIIKIEKVFFVKDLSNTYSYSEDEYGRILTATNIRYFEEYYIGEEVYEESIEVIRKIVI